MKLKVKDMDISTGGPLISIISQNDADKLDLHSLDRILIRKGNKRCIAIVDIGESKKAIASGKIGVFEEVMKKLNLKNNDIVEITLAKSPKSIDYIKKKLNGGRLSKKEINQIVEDIVNNRLSEIELTYFVSACYTKTMTLEETILLTKAMANSGDIIKPDAYPVIDKHCIGGIPGNRTTIVLVPIISAAGFVMPKTSSRSITSPAGTADSMEVLARVAFNKDKIERIIKKVKGCIVWGGALNLAPADDAIIKVEKPLGLDAENQLLASIMAKKYSVGSTHILIDIPIGKTAKIKNRKEALNLKKQFETIGKKLRKHVRVMITDGNQPVGNGIGPALEARDCLFVLKRDPKRPLDLEEKCIKMATEIFNMAGLKDGRKKAIEILNSGKAYKQLVKIIKAQGGKEPDINKLPLGRYKYDVKSVKKGIIKEIDNIFISKIARIAGAPSSKGAGIYLCKHVGNKVKKGEKLFIIYSESKEKLEFAKEILSEMDGIVIR